MHRFLQDLAHVNNEEDAMVADVITQSRSQFVVTLDSGVKCTMSKECFVAQFQQNKYVYDSI